MASGNYRLSSWNLQWILTVLNLVCSNFCCISDLYYFWIEVRYLWLDRSAFIQPVEDLKRPRLCSLRGWRESWLWSGRKRWSVVWRWDKRESTFQSSRKIDTGFGQILRVFYFFKSQIQILSQIIEWQDSRSGVQTDRYLYVFMACGTNEKSLAWGKWWASSTNPFSSTLHSFRWVPQILFQEQRTLIVTFSGGISNFFSFLVAIFVGLFEPSFK